MDWNKQKNVWGVEQRLLAGDGFHVSFTERSLVDDVPSFRGDNDGGPETALIVPGAYLILNGDHRAEYEKRFPQGFAACRAYFDEQAPHCKSSWSD